MTSLVKSELNGTNCCCCFNSTELFNMLKPCKIEDMDCDIIARLISECFQIEIKSAINDKRRDYFMMCKLCVLRLKDAVQFRYQVQNAYDSIEGMVEDRSFSFASCTMDVNYEFSLDPETTVDDFVSVKIEKKDVPHNEEHSNSDSHYSAEDYSLDNDAHDNKHAENENKYENDEKLPVEFMKKKSKIDCGVCQKTFTSKAWFKKHLVQHGNPWTDESFACNHCGRAFPDKSSLKKHITDHADIKDFICDQCGVLFKEEGPFKSHVKTHKKSSDGLAIHHCERCPKAFASRRALRKHREIHSGKVHTCEFCGKTYASRRSLRAHYVKHLNDPEIETKMSKVIKQRRDTNHCTHCNKTFGRQRALKEHLLRVNGIRNFECDICQKTFINKYNILRHMRIHLKKEFLCNHCGKAFTRSHNLDRHLLSHTNKSYSCDVCFKSFTTKGNYEFHRTTHDKAHFACRYCAAVFSNASDLKKHADTICEEKKFECDICKKRFVSTISLSSHSKVHERPTNDLICDYCGKSFSRRPTLLYHIRSHMQLETFQCAVCAKFFQNSQTLRRHMKCHKAVRDYICQNCGKGFVTKNHLEMHMASHLGIRNFRCEPCNKGFLRKYHLTKHLRTCPNTFKAPQGLYGFDQSRPEDIQPPKRELKFEPPPPIPHFY